MSEDCRGNDASSIEAQSIAKNDDHEDGAG